MNGIHKHWCVTAALCFSYTLMQCTAGVSDAEEQWFGLEKSLCSFSGETNQPAWSEAVLKRRGCP